MSKHLYPNFFTRSNSEAYTYTDPFFEIKINRWRKPQAGEPFVVDVDPRFVNFKY